MTNLPPSGSRTIPNRARKSQSGVAGGFGAAVKAGVENVNDPNFQPPAKEKKQPQIRIARQTYNSLIAAKILKMSLAALVFLVLVYFCFAMTILRIVPSVSTGPLLTKNITFPGGIIPAGELVVVDIAQPHGTEITDYLEQSFIPNSNLAIMRVHAGPWGSFDWDTTGVVSVDGQILPVEIPPAVSESGEKLDYPQTLRGDTKLNDEYLMSCVEGACVPGRGYVYPITHILGQPIGKGR